MKAKNALLYLLFSVTPNLMAKDSMPNSPNGILGNPSLASQQSRRIVFTRSFVYVWSERLSLIAEFPRTVPLLPSFVANLESVQRHHPSPYRPEDRAFESHQRVILYFTPGPQG
jgi:hypothetical protein